jgi:hypothetical protein
VNAILTGLKHVKTTAAGIVAILTGLGMLAPEINKVANGDFAAIDFGALKAAFAAVAIGVGLIFAKDADKSNAPSPLPAAEKVS